MKKTFLALVTVAVSCCVSAQNKTFEANGVRFEMIYVEGGTYAKGDPAKPENASVGNFYIAQTEVTQNLWKAVMGKKSNALSRGKNCPADQISWNDCQEFISKLNQITGANFRLPTEAEWEYAARGGKKTHNYKLSGGTAMGKIGWYNGNSNGEPQPVATKTANELGVYDMSGNLWEWCSDVFADGQHVMRGGCWNSTSQACWVWNTTKSDAAYKSDICGLRLAMDE